MNVTEAVASRRSVRQFLDKPVDQTTLQRVLAKAQRSPSGGNTQPWNAVILTGAPLA
ncbi:MAG: nitroreductase family protein, partial [Sphingomonadaceae bacterium]|nr:nitroreductase family protein [Sphingomonadaceae bacterium]